MPEPETNIPQSSWADEIEEGDVELPPPSERVVGDTKIVTVWAYNDEGKKVKIVRTYKVERKLVSKAVARRKALPKFGMSAGDRPGPNPATTVVAEEVLMQVRRIWRNIGTTSIRLCSLCVEYDFNSLCAVLMQFVANKDESEKDEADKSALDMLKERNKGVVKCRICKEDHWTTNCPYKDTLGPLRDSLAGKEVSEEGAASGAEGGPGASGGPSGASGPSGAAGGTGGGGPGGGGAASSGGKYVPPSRRGGESALQRLGESMPDRRRSKHQVGRLIDWMKGVRQSLHAIGVDNDGCVDARLILASSVESIGHIVS